MEVDVFHAFCRLALEARLDQWIDWALRDLPVLVAEGLGEHSAIHEQGPPCPLLVDDLVEVRAPRPVGQRPQHELLARGELERLLVLVALRRRHGAGYFVARREGRTEIDQNAQSCDTNQNDGKCLVACSHLLSPWPS